MLRLRVVATAADGESDIVNSGMFRSMRLAHAVGRTGPRWKGNSPRPTFLSLLLCASSFKHCDADHRIASSLRRQQKSPGCLSDGGWLIMMHFAAAMRLRKSLIAAAFIAHIRSAMGC
jgi:hypothetical protein